MHLGYKVLFLKSGGESCLLAYLKAFLELKEKFNMLWRLHLFLHAFLSAN